MTDKQFNGRLVLNVGPDLHQWLYERAAAHDMTMNKYARKLIRDELERHARAADWNIDREYITYKQPPYSAPLVLPHVSEEFLRLIGESNKDQR
jgi:hypothetical protein